MLEKILSSAPLDIFETSPFNQSYFFRTPTLHNITHNCNFSICYNLNMTNLQFRLIVTGGIILLVILGLTVGDQDHVNMMEKTREWIQSR